MRSTRNRHSKRSETTVPTRPPSEAPSVPDPVDTADRSDARGRRVAPFFWRPVTFRRESSRPSSSVVDTNPDLAIRNLLDDPRLRACLTSSLPAPTTVAVVAGLPRRVRGASLSAALREGVERAAA